MKRLISVFFAVIFISAVLTACSGTIASDIGSDVLSHQRIEPDSVTRVTATDALYSSYLYVIEDESAVRELVGVYNNLAYCEPDDGEKAPQLISGRLYTLTYFGSNDINLGSCNISPEGYVVFDDFEHPYKLLNDFDEARIKKLLEDNNTFK